MYIFAHFSVEGLKCIVISDRDGVALVEGINLFSFEMTVLDHHLLDKVFCIQKPLQGQCVLYQ